MTDLQLYLAVGLPIITILASLTLSLIQISAIREDTRTQIGTIREDTRTQIATIREDIREIRNSVQILTGKVYELMGQR